MHHLLNWLKFNPDYNDRVEIPQALEECKDEFELRLALKDLFAKCLDFNQTDPNLLVCAGITSFQERNFSQAAYMFKQAIKQNPTDHSLWNKYGAALTNNF